MQASIRSEETLSKSRVKRGTQKKGIISINKGVMDLKIMRAGEGGGAAAVGERKILCGSYICLCPALDKPGGKTPPPRAGD